MSDRPVFYEEGIAMSSPNSNVNGGDDDHLLQRSGPSTAAVEREHMFDKVVTPSDVGKLNRLVIPKQHAEKYFPLDSSTNEKGLVLNFEDRNGKPWRFRYSYWNSSQSYVMTKGWSRFVKEKKLDAGDIVSFQRGLVADKDRLFIDWRRRPDPLPNHFSTSFQYSSTTNPWNHLFLNANAPPPPPPPEYSPYYNHLAQHQNQNQNQNQYGINYGYDTSVVNGNPCPPGSIFYLSRPGNGTGSGAGGGSGFIVEEGVVQKSEQMPVPVVQGKAAAKRLRLFGVNMDCPIQQESMLSDSNTVPLHQYFPASPTTSSSSSFPNSLHLMRPNYSDNNDDEDDKGKGSMSLDLDI